MKYHHQLITHNPEVGLLGDCFRTCLACLLEMDCPSEVPHFMDDPTESQQETWWRVDQWLGWYHGLRHIAFPFSVELGVACEVVGRANPGLRFLVTGAADGGEETNTNHTVLCDRYGVCWDPCPNKSGITGPCLPAREVYWLGLLVPYKVHGSTIQTKQN